MITPTPSLTEDELVDLPVLQVLLEDKGAHVRVEVEHARAVDVQDRVEAVPVPVEEELCPRQARTERGREREEALSFRPDGPKKVGNPSITHSTHCLPLPSHV